MKKLVMFFAAVALVAGLALGAQAQTTYTITFEEVAAWGVDDGSPGPTPIEETIHTAYDAMGVNFEDVLSAPTSIDRCGEIFDTTTNPSFAFVGSEGNVLGLDNTGAGSGFMVVLDTPAQSVSIDWAWVGDPGTAHFMAFSGPNPVFPAGTANNLLIQNGYDVTFTGGIDISANPGTITFTDETGTGITVFTISQPLFHRNMAWDNLTWTIASGGPPSEEQYTGIQITGLSSDISDNVIAGDTVTFTATALTSPGMGPLNYRFFTRKGYEMIADAVNPWGGSRWVNQQDWSSTNSVSITFDEPGVYFMAAHFSEDTTWSAGPQTGMVVEVWPVQ